MVSFTTPCFYGMLFFIAAYGMSIFSARRLSSGVKVSVEIDISSTIQYLSSSASPANIAALNDQIVAALNTSTLSNAIVAAVSNAVRNAYQIDITDLVVSLDSASIAKTGTTKSISSGSRDNNVRLYFFAIGIKEVSARVSPTSLKSRLWKK
jgi:hypothetical protein